MFSNRCSGSKSWNHLISLYAPVIIIIIKKVIWLHLAQVTYLPQRVKMIWCNSWIKRPNAFCVLQAVDGIRSENRADAGIIYPMAWVMPLIPPKICSNSGPWRIWMLSRRLTFSTLHISHTWQCEHPRKVKIGWPVSFMWLARYQSFISTALKGSK